MVAWWATERHDTIFPVIVETLRKHTKGLRSIIPSKSKRIFVSKCYKIQKLTSALPSVQWHQ